MVNKINFAFFGTSEVSVSVLDSLNEHGFTPKLIVTNPDKPKGRKFVLTPTPVKVWALEHQIPTLEPEKLDAEFIEKLQQDSWDLFLVVAYGKIMPKTILELPKFKSINIHYSLLPKLRGSSPVEGAILTDDRNTGVSIILMDEKMDHGPILAQAEVSVPIWPPKRSDLMGAMNHVANKLLVELIPKIVSGEITPEAQDESKATYVSMIKKEDALIDLSDDPYLNFKKIMAYERWPRAYFIENNKRVVVNSAEWADGALNILTVTPEGKKEMRYSDYLRSANTI